MAIQIGLYVSNSFAPILLKSVPLGPSIGPNDPCGGIFALGNFYIFCGMDASREMVMVKANYLHKHSDVSLSRRHHWFR